MTPDRQTFAIRTSQTRRIGRDRRGMANDRKDATVEVKIMAQARATGAAGHPAFAEGQADAGPAALPGGPQSGEGAAG